MSIKNIKTEDIKTDKDITSITAPSKERGEKMDFKISDITIDPELSSLIQALTEEEFAGLEESLKKDGFRDPLVVWDWEGKWLLLDGHNRVKIGKKLKVESVSVVVKKFRDRNEAEEWIIRNQLDRRNLTPDAASLLRGRLFNKQKKNGHDGGKGQERSGGHNAPHLKTAERLGKEHGVDASTIKRDGQLADAVDALKPHVPDIERRVLSGDIPSKKMVIEAAKAPKKAVKMLADKTARVPKTSGESEGHTPLEYLKAVQKVIDGMDYDPASKSGKEAAAKYESGKGTEACVFVKNETETESFQRLLAASSAVCFIRGTVRLLDPKGKPKAQRQGMVMIYMGPNKKQFIAGFKAFGVVLERNGKETVAHGEEKQAA